MPSFNMPWSEVLYWAGWNGEWPENSAEEIKLCTELADTIDNLTTSLVKIIVRAENLAEMTKLVSDVQGASKILRKRRKTLEDLTDADFQVLSNIWTNLDGFALQEGLLALLKKAAEGIAANAYQAYAFDDERECLKVIKDAAQTDRAELLCRYLTLVIDHRLPCSASKLQESTKSNI